MSKRVAFRVHGEVQEKATSYSLTGWVKNAANGKVEGEVQGSEEDVQKLLKDIDKGPTHAHVVRVDKSDLDPVDGESKFERIACSHLINTHHFNTLAAIRYVFQSVMGDTIGVYTRIKWGFILASG
ncbi:putative Acylphosphatase [Glarea lozoyensis 74030]|uniref:Putative Acylphosphatase n=1 Tax=Glarea lozoyensis (strain ATCC 74030 / MF5533) TaxID=1104152 RepID=H0ES25_GLAL7|nr:putative Acylphosphatase [Glarea lozoyensis 74030]